jgi:hypothetical protein
MTLIEAMLKANEARAAALCPMRSRTLTCSLPSSFDRRYHLDVLDAEEARSVFHVLGLSADVCGN